MDREGAKILKGTKRITITDRDTSSRGLFVHVHLEEWKKKLFWSLRCSWCVTDGIGTGSDDRDKNIQSCLINWTEQYPGIEIINTSTRIKYSPNFLKRKVLIEKIANGKTYKPKSIKPKRVMCVDDGTLSAYECRFNDGTTELTAGTKYWAWEHPSNEDRLESFDKFLYVRNNLGKRSVYPKRLFKEKWEK
jgi:hypothetical protein